MRPTDSRSTSSGRSPFTTSCSPPRQPQRCCTKQRTPSCTLTPTITTSTGASTKPKPSRWRTIVAGVLGLDTSSKSIGYIAGWTDGDLETVTSTATRVLATAQTILDGITEDDEK